MNVTVQTVARILSDNFGLEAQGFKSFASELASVFRAETFSGPVSVKVMSAKTHDLRVVQWQADLVERAGSHGLPVAQALPHPDGSVLQLEIDGSAHFVQVTRWLPGAPLLEIERSPEVLSQVGRISAELAGALRGSPPPPATVTHLWRLERTIEMIDNSLYAVTDLRQRGSVEHARRIFLENIVPAIPSLPAAVVHHDLHDSNLLFEPTEQGLTLSGILDFGDAVLGVRCAELAVAAGYAARGTDDPALAFDTVVRGWLSVGTLDAAEAKALLPAAIGRLAVNLALWSRLGLTRQDAYADDRSALTDRALTLLLAAHEAGLGERIEAHAAKQRASANSHNPHERHHS